MSDDSPKPVADFVLRDYPADEAEIETVRAILDEGIAAPEDGGADEEGTAESLLGSDFVADTAHPHGSNILKKARDSVKEGDENKTDLIKEIAARYTEWRTAAEDLECEDLLAPTEFANTQTRLYEDYRNLLDDERVDVFDSRGALQPSALEEFCYFLLRPIFAEQEARLAIGHREVFQGLYFTAPNFSAFLDMPTANYPVGNLDFVIGKEVRSRMTTDARETERSIYVPAVALECKTYLDRPRWIESEILATNIKRGFPGCLYILLSEFLKLDLTKVNVLGSQIDKVYVLRRAKNVDRKIRRAEGTGLTPLHAPAVVDLFERVRDHLREDWVAPEQWETSGILK